MNARGFTVLELLLASLILAMVGTMTWGALSATFQTQRSIERATRLQELGTAIMMRLREDLSQTFHVEASRPQTFFLGEDHLNHDTIHFTSLSHFSTSVDAQESDQTEISYLMESNPEDSSLWILKRRGTLFIDGEIDPEEDGEYFELARNVVEFNIQYSADGVDFDPAWDIRSVDKMNRLPKLVRVDLLLRDPQGREERFWTFVDLPMAENLGVEFQVPNQPGGQNQPGNQNQSGNQNQNSQGGSSQQRPGFRPGLPPFGNPPGGDD